MKKFIAFMAILALLVSCGKSGDKGEFGVQEVSGTWETIWYDISAWWCFIMGKSDDDVASIQDAPTKTVTVRSFYMDETKLQIVSTVNL
jgi:hypothetical protein